MLIQMLLQVRLKLLPVLANVKEDMAKPTTVNNMFNIGMGNTGCV